MSTNNNKFHIACLGIICFTALELVALYKGLDGTYFATVIAGIGTIVGYMFGFRIGEERERAKTQE